MTVPFENQDIHLPRSISFDTEKIFDKIVGDRRGGFCFEMNGLFVELLRSPGFTVRLLSAQHVWVDGRS